MSLIVAGFDNGSLTIVSDTKLTYPNDRNNDNRWLKNHVPFGAVETSVLKSMLINEFICVSFAGDSMFAEQAIKLIKCNESPAQIADLLLEWHRFSNSKTDFILCFILSVPEVYLIKNQSIEKVVDRVAWIGDDKAYSKFQEGRLGGNQTFVDAMDNVISSARIPTVGGFKTVIRVDQGKFTYGTSVEMHREPMTFRLQAGVPQIIGHGTAEDGAYTLHFLGASDDFRQVAFHVKQGNFGVLYDRVDDGLLRPTIVSNVDEVDFCDYLKDKYELSPRLLTQDRFHKFFSDGLWAYNSGNFLKAVTSFKKALKERGELQNVELLFYVGVCLHCLKEPAQALEFFRKVVSIDASY
jgi:hypothetical protein